MREPAATCAQDQRDGRLDPRERTRVVHLVRRQERARGVGLAQPPAHEHLRERARAPERRPQPLDRGRVARRDRGAATAKPRRAGGSPRAAVRGQRRWSERGHRPRLRAATTEALRRRTRSAGDADRAVAASVHDRPAARRTGAHPEPTGPPATTPVATSGGALGDSGLEPFPPDALGVHGGQAEHRAGDRLERGQQVRVVLAGDGEAVARSRTRSRRSARRGTRRRSRPRSGPAGRS